MSLGKLDLELGHVNLSAESVGRFLFVGRFEKQLDGLAHIDLGIFKRLPLAWDVQFRSQGDESIAFSFENGGKGFGHGFDSEVSTLQALSCNRLGEFRHLAMRLKPLVINGST